jgi:plasmid replication initiation protein
VGTQRMAPLERNLERYPWSRLSDDRGQQDLIERLFADAESEGRAWRVSASKVPGPFDADVYVAVMELWQRAGRPADRTVHVSVVELLELMDRPKGGTTYTAVESALHRLAEARVTAVRTWRTGPVLSERKTFNLVNVTTRRHDPTTGDLTSAEIELSREIVESIEAGHVRYLDAGCYFALRTPTAKRLYRYLDYRRWRGRVSLDEVEISVDELRSELPIDQSVPSHVVRAVLGAAVELEDIGYLRYAAHQQHPVAGRKRPAHAIRFAFAEREVETRPIVVGGSAASEPVVRVASAVDVRDSVKALVPEIIRTLKDDERSHRFYVKVAQALPEEIVRSHLGVAREMLREEWPLDAVRKTFTKRCRDSAVAAGVAL